MTEKLTTRQTKFVDEYILCGNGSEAARRAGYSEHTARQMATENLSKPSIKATLAARKALEAQRLEIRKEDVLGAILGAIQMARTERNPAVMIRGWVEVARMTGLDKPESTPVSALSPEADAVRRRFEAMSTDELLELVATRNVNSWSAQS